MPVLIAKKTVVAPPPDPLPEDTSFIRMADNNVDAPTWKYSNHAFQTEWNNLGGDWRDRNEDAQGTDPYAVWTINSNTSAAYDLDVTDLVQQWITLGNTGLHMRRVSGGIFYVGGRTYSVADGKPADKYPVLTVQTEEGTFECLALCTTRISSSQLEIPGPIDTSQMLPDVIMRFDLRSVAGTTVVSANLRLWTIALSGGSQPSVFHLNRIESTEIIYAPATQIGGAVDGIAAEGASDADLAEHADVIAYDSLSDATTIANNLCTLFANHSGTDPSYGVWSGIEVPYLNCVVGTTNERGAKLIKYMQPLNAQPHTLDDAPFRRTYTPGQEDGYNELWYRQLFEVTEDWYDGFDELGCKFGGLEGLYDFGAGADVTGAPSARNKWSYWLHMTKKSIEHPHIYRFDTYSYDYDWPYSQHPSLGQIRYPNIVKNLFWKAGRVVSVEQYVKLNTFAATVTGDTDDVDLTNNTLTVPSNVDTWTTGLEVTFSCAQGTSITGLSFINYFIIRVSDTLVQLATTAENATNGIAVDFTAKSNPIWTLAIPNADGIYRVWWDGVLVHERTDLRIRGEPSAQIQDYLIQVYHGGTGNYPSQPITVRQGGPCLATSYIGPPKTAASELPDWVPQPGFFREVTTNTMDAAVSGLLGAGFVSGVIGNWCGGVFIPDFGTMGGVAYHGGREHTAGVVTNVQQSVIVWDIANQQYVVRCYPSGQTNFQPSVGPGPAWIGTPTDNFGTLETDGSPGTMHTYNGLCWYPSEWGGGSSGSIVRVCQSAGNSKTLFDAADPSSESYAATWKFDLSKAEHTSADPAITRLTGNNNYHLTVSSPSFIDRISDAPFACIDTIRQGYWSFCRTSAGGKGMSFTTKDGVITNFVKPPLALALWAKMHHFPDDDILCVICDEPTFGTQRTGVVKLLDLSNPAASWVHLSPTQPVDVSFLASGSFTSDHLMAGYGGPQWSTLLNCFVMLDHKNPSGVQTQLRIWKLIPPPPGQRFTGEWVWTVETILSEDGSSINVRGDKGSANGSFGKLVECPDAKCLLWTRNVNQKGIAIRLAGHI